MGGPTKLQRAIEAIDRGEKEYRAALSLLGGRVRYRSKKWPDQKYTARLYLEGVVLRSAVIRQVLTGMWTPPEPEQE